MRMPAQRMGVTLVCAYLRKGLGGYPRCQIGDLEGGGYPRCQIGDLEGGGYPSVANLGSRGWGVPLGGKSGI